MEDGIVWGTDKEQHMRMLDEKLQFGAMGKERIDIIGMMNSLRSLMVREACVQDAKEIGGNDEKHLADLGRNCEAWKRNETGNQSY